jgi:enamine deaminase RidA (YjgF/YER057c/UK114 family)
LHDFLNRKHPRTMQTIRRFGTHPRWSDVVIHQHTARWVEVASDLNADSHSQISQILAQIDDTLAALHSERADLLEVIIHLASLEDVQTLNQLWDQWIPAGHAPVRACLQSGLGAQCRAEFIVHAATDL